MQISYTFINVLHQLFLAHLAQSAKVRYWDCAVSGVHCRPSGVNNFFKDLLLINHWMEVD